MPIRIEFLGLERPGLIMAAEYLVSRFERAARVDLRRTIVVVPGGRAGRRLLEVLVAECDARRLLLVPPTIETVGRLPEQLYRPQRPFASDLTQRIVWAQTLQAAPAALLAPVIPRPPSGEDFARWMDLGDLLRRQHQELAADGLDFGDVARQGGEIAGFAEETRWLALQQLQDDYLKRLDAIELWDLQTARLVAVEKRECTTDRDIVLVGTADMNITLRRMLDQVAERVTSLVVAPPEWADRFDSHGCLAPERWTSVSLPITTEQVISADGPLEQAVTVRRVIAGFEGKYRADEIVVGIPDEELVPDVQRVLAAAEIPARWGPGTPLAESSPGQLVRCVARFLEHDRYAEFASLLRHADISGWLVGAGAPSALAELDEYYQEHLPYQMGTEWLGSRSHSASLRAAGEQIQQALAGLRQPPRPLAQWTAPILRLLTEIYGDRVLDRSNPADQAILSAIDAICEILNQHGQVPAELMPTVSANTALRWLLDELQPLALPSPADPLAIELLGWLELPLDDAPALIVTTFCEGCVPSSVNSDVFLPNALRQQLGITDNQRRYARDAYAASVLAMTRESLHLIVARRTREGDPLAPSRLLFATDALTAARRALMFFGSGNRILGGAAQNASESGHTSDSPPPASRGDGTRVGHRDGITAPEPVHRLTVPRPRPLAAPITQLNVTSFRDYRACPYRFYLRHVLRLDAIDDSAREMDGRAFGNLAHAVLRQFGNHPRCHSSDPDEIAEILNHELNRWVAKQYGEYALPAVRVQVEQLRMRLLAYAPLQARHAAAGWRIEFTELAPPGSCPAELIVDGIPFQLRGRMDRIDVHAESGTRVIWDYKTSDAAQSPDDTHLDHGEWMDLQLPLYRHLARAAGVPSPVKLGYILLPKDTSQTQMVLADWDETLLAEADQTACRIIRALRQEEFWPPARKPPPFTEVFSSICQDGVLGRESWE